MHLSRLNIGVGTRAVISIGTALCVSSCGIPHEKHQAVLRDLERTKSALAGKQNTLDRVHAERDALKDRAAAIEGDKDLLAKRLGASEKELAALRKARRASEERMKTFRQLAKRLHAMIASGKLDVKIRKGRMIVQLGDKILFDPGKKKLKSDGQAALSEVAIVLRDIRDRHFLVAGHTDNVPIKTRRFRSNLELSSARAVEVVDFLQSQGVDPVYLAAAGYSEYDPVGDNETPEGRRANRRIEIVLMPNIAELPATDDLGT